MKKLIALMVLTAVITTIPAFADRQKTEELYQNSSTLTQIMSLYYQVEQAIVVTIGQNCEYADDVIVTLFLAKTAEADPVTINNWRKTAMSWEQVMKKLKISPTVLFVPVKPADVPPDFGHAYNQYFEWEKNNKKAIKIYDKEVRRLAGLRFMVDRYKDNPANVMKKIQQGKSYSDLILEKETD